MSEKMRIVTGGGFSFLTADPIMVAVVERCAELEAELRSARYTETARFITLRRDVAQIKRTVLESKT